MVLAILLSAGLWQNTEALTQLLVEEQSDEMWKIADVGNGKGKGVIALRDITVRGSLNYLVHWILEGVCREENWFSVKLRKKWQVIIRWMVSYGRRYDVFDSPTFV